MHPQVPRNDPVQHARKRVRRNVLMVLGLGSTFCVLLGFGALAGGPAFMVFQPEPQSAGGADQPLTSLLMGTGLATALFLWQLRQSWREYRQVSRQQDTGTNATTVNHYRAMRGRRGSL